MPRSAVAPAGTSAAVLLADDVQRQRAGDVHAAAAPGARDRGRAVGVGRGVLGQRLDGDRRRGDRTAVPSVARVATSTRFTATATPTPEAPEPTVLPSAVAPDLWAEPAWIFTAPAVSCAPTAPMRAAVVPCRRPKAIAPARPIEPALVSALSAVEPVVLGAVGGRLVVAARGAALAGLGAGGDVGVAVGATFTLPALIAPVLSIAAVVSCWAQATATPAPAGLERRVAGRVRGERVGRRDDQVAPGVVIDVRAREAGRGRARRLA